MPNFEDPEELRRLSALYAEQTDEELLELRVAFDDLTDGAQGALRDEMMRRRIWSAAVPEITVVRRPPEPLDIDPEDLRNHIRNGGIALRVCNSIEEANLLCFVLGHHKVRSEIYWNNGASDLYGPRLMVAPDDEDEARAILAKSISEELRREFEEMPDPDEEFTYPACPSCSSNDVMLESVDPTNQWSCVDCGATWQDSIPETEASK